MFMVSLYLALFVDIHAVKISKNSQCVICQVVYPGTERGQLVSDGS